MPRGEIVKMDDKPPGCSLVGSVKSGSRREKAVCASCPLQGKCDKFC